MNETALILNFDQVGTELEMVGGKGLNLIRLTQAGMPVPLGFIVSTVAYQLFVQANQLDERIQLLLPASPNGQPPAAVSAQIRAAFEAGHFPAILMEQITAAYRELCARAGQSDVPVAVRSSATAEDLAEASFSGQQDTFLNVRGEQALLDAIKRGAPSSSSVNWR